MIIWPRSNQGTQIRGFFNPISRMEGILSYECEAVYEKQEKIQRQLFDNCHSCLERHTS